MSLRNSAKNTMKIMNHNELIGGSFLVPNLFKNVCAILLTLLLMQITGHMLRPSEQRQQQHPKASLKN
jgi:hypothetical protein